MTVYVRRYGGPIVAGEHGPRFTPMRSGSVELRVHDLRAARSSMRSSSSPVHAGAPAVRMILPPSWSMSVARKVTPCASAALLHVPRPARRARRRRPSAPSRLDAARRRRRSARTRPSPGGARAPPPPASRCSRSADRHARREVDVGGIGGRSGRVRSASRERRRRSRTPGPSAAPTSRPGAARAVSGLTHDLARDRPRPPSSTRRRVAAGPVDDQLAVRAADEEELERPGVHADRHAQRRPCPAEVVERARSGAARRRMPTRGRGRAARRGRRPRRSSSSASPPNLIRPPPLAYAIGEQRARTRADRRR